MTPSLVQRILTGAAMRGPAPVALAHPECPIEQSVKSAQPHTQTALLGEAWRRHPPAGEGAMIVAEAEGVRVLGRSEGALRPVVEGFRERFGRDVVVGAPRVRYAHRPYLAEPWMTVLASGPGQFAPLLMRDLARRKARVLRVEQHRGPFVIEAEAPLANLLGYGDWLDDLAEGRADLSMWLARYVPVDVDDSPDAA